MAALILFGVFFLLLFMNMPIAFALGISSLSVILYEGLPLLPVASNSTRPRASSCCWPSPSSS